MSKYRPRTAEQYMQGVERELAEIAKLEEAYSEDIGFDHALLISSTMADGKGRLAQVAATIRLAEAQEHTNELLEQLGSLIGLHPVLTHVMATQNMVLERNALIDQQNDEIAQLKVAAAAANSPEDADGKPN